jgi:TPR repeat protein
MDDEIVPACGLIYISNDSKTDEDNNFNKIYIEKIIINGNSKKKNDIESINILARCCYTGYNINSNIDTALILHNYAANLGNLNSQRALGYYYKYISKDSNKRFKWYQMAADQGDEESIIEIARMFIMGRKNCDFRQVTSYLLGVVNTSTRAQYYLGYVYKYICINDYEAVEWFTISAIHGYFYAQYELGLLYKTSRTELKNYAESLKWFTAAFINKNNNGRYGKKLVAANLGEIYEHGLGIQVDLQEAIKYYKLASEHDRIKNIIIKNSGKIGTIICNTNDKIKDQQKILDIQDQYIVELEYMPQGPKYTSPKIV